MNTKHHSSRTLLVQRVLLLLSLLIACRLGFAQQADETLQFELGDNGLKSLRYGGWNLISPGEGRFGIPPQSMVFRKADGTVFRDDGKVNDYSVDAQRKIVAIKGAGVSLSCRYEGAPHGLELFVTLKNTHPEADIIAGRIELMHIMLPEHDRLFGNVDNRDRFVHMTQEFDRYRLSVINWTIGRNANMQYHVQHGTYGTPIEFQFIERMPKHELIDSKWWAEEPINLHPGEEAEFRVSLRFAKKDAPPFDHFKDALEYFREQMPQTLNWPDRRPIGRLFMANPTTGWKTNPRGWIVGSKEKTDVFTREGMEQFRTELMAYADRCINVLKNNDAQGVIMWDLEGAQFPHAITYIGHPQMLPQVAPEMDAYADEFFKKFKDAGLRTGITIRPTEVYATEKEWPAYNHRNVADPVQLMLDKIAYAKERWGCTLFYLDSNVFEKSTVPWVMPSSMIRALHEAHPDVLIIPEWPRPTMYPYSAGYSTSNLGTSVTDPLTRAIWPQAFNTMALAAHFADGNYDRVRDGMAQGDVGFIYGWMNPADNQLVATMRAENTWRKNGPPAQLKEAEPKVLFEHVEDENPEVRFHVANLLGQSGKGEGVPALIALSNDTYLAVQQAALKAMGQVPPASVNDIARQRLLGLLISDMPEGRGFLRRAAADSIAKLGETMVPALLKLARDEKLKKDPRMAAIEALGRTGTTNDDARKQLLAWIKSENADVRYASIQALGALQEPGAVDPIVELMNSKPPHKLLLACVAALDFITQKHNAPQIVPLLASLLPQNFDFLQNFGIKFHARAAMRNVAGRTIPEPEWVNWYKSYVVFDNSKPEDTERATRLISEQTNWLRGELPEAIRSSDKSADSLIKLTTHTDPAVRFHAMRLLPPMRDPRAQEVLWARLNDPNMSVRRAAIEALDRVKVDDMGRKNNILKFADIADDKKPENVTIRNMALARLGGPGDVMTAPLMEFIANESEPIELRRSAIRSLGFTRTRKPEARQMLERFAADVNSPFQAAAKAALEFLPK